MDSSHFRRDEVVLTREFHAPVATVWRAITDPVEMRKWYFNVDDFKAEVGSQTRFNIPKDQGDAGPKNFIHVWRVTEVIFERKITYSWKFEGLPGESFLTWELFPEGDGTRLKLCHIGLETFLPEQNPDLASDNFIKGWNYIIGTALAGFLNK